MLEATSALGAKFYSLPDEKGLIAAARKSLDRGEGFFASSATARSRPARARITWGFIGAERETVRARPR